MSDAAFERWLRDSLRREYGKVQCEPIPDALLRLLDVHSGARPTAVRKHC